MKNSFESLLFRDQFYLSNKPLALFDSWGSCDLPNGFRYCGHRGLKHQVIKSRTNPILLLIVGNIVSAVKGEKVELHLRQALDAPAVEIDGILRQFHNFCGRFAVFAFVNDEVFVFNDACGLMRLYCYLESGLHVYSCNSALVKHLTGDRDSSTSLEYRRSYHYSHYPEHWVPTNCDLYIKTRILQSNHYLRDRDGRQTRYWPLEKPHFVNLAEAADEITDLLANIVRNAADESSLAITVTGGLDSRIGMGASIKGGCSDYYYTWAKTNDLNHYDATMGRAIADLCGVKHNVLEWEKESGDLFAGFYRISNEYYHQYWEDLAASTLKIFPAGYVSVRGNCSEVGRSYYRKYMGASNKLVSESLLFLPGMVGWHELGCVRKALDEWESEIAPICNDFGIDILDMLFWEQRMGSWQAQSFNECDLLHPTLCPFNCRAILEKMVFLPISDKIGPECKLHHRIIANLLGDDLARSIAEMAFGKKKSRFYAIYNSKPLISLRNRVFVRRLFSK